MVVFEYVYIRAPESACAFGDEVETASLRSTSDNTKLDPILSVPSSPVLLEASAFPNIGASMSSTTTAESYESRVNLGPLTTTFTPGPSCLPFIDGINLVYLAQTCTTEASLADDPACWPSPSDIVPSSPPLTGYGVYSPGNICPAGYTTACSQTASEVGNRSTTSGNFLFQYPPTASERAYGCCPT